MLEFLVRGFKEQSVLWLLLSAVAGAVIKLIFDSWIAPRLTDRRLSHAALRLYRYPLLRSADALDRRLENFVRHDGARWYTGDDDYYRISTLYLFGTFFAWAGHLEDVAFIDYLVGRRARRFSTHFFRTFKGLTSYFYFQPADGTLKGAADASVSRFVLTAIGELMVQKRPEKDGERPSVIDFVTFCARLEKDAGFQKWFGYLDAFVRRVERDRNNAHWQRLLIFATQLRVFVAFLDPSTNRTARRELFFLSQMREDVRKVLEREIVAAGHGDLLPKASDAPHWRRRLDALRWQREARRELATQRKRRRGRIRADAPKDHRERSSEPGTAQLGMGATPPTAT